MADSCAFDDAVRNLAVASTTPISEYVFLARGTISFNNVEMKDVNIGDMDYANRAIQLYYCMRHKNWIFVVEENTVANTVGIGAFFRNEHYLFQTFPKNTQVEEVRKVLISFFVAKILPLADAEIKSKIFATDKNLAWKSNIWEKPRFYSSAELGCLLPKKQ